MKKQPYYHGATDKVVSKSLGMVAVYGMLLLLKFAVIAVIVIASMMAHTGK